MARTTRLKSFEAVVAATKDLPAFLAPGKTWQSAVSDHSLAGGSESESILS